MRGTEAVPPVGVGDKLPELATGIAGTLPGAAAGIAAAASTEVVSPGTFSESGTGAYFPRASERESTCKVRVFVRLVSESICASLGSASFDFFFPKTWASTCPETSKTIRRVTNAFMSLIVIIDYGLCGEACLKISSLLISSSGPW
ncbi:MAG: hypothetical protein MZV63_49840 [Marinilabiliales bacterium]|nr:hypothetical protein [Marinilabiliales bacterium]